MIRHNRKIQFIILFVLVCLVGTISIAYAVLSTTLNITGNTEVVASNWNVHFANVEANPASVNPIKTPIITDSKTIDFSVVLNKPGDFYKFNVDIVNDGSINAMIDSVIKSPDLTTEQAKYIKYEIEYINGESISTKQLLASGETKTISVLLSYRTDISASDLPSTPTTLSLSIQLNYVQADQTSTEVTTSPKKIKVVNGDLDTVGSEICIGEECFYLISNDGYKVTMLAKYNLYVGGVYDGTTYTFYGEEATGIQNKDMRGYVGTNMRLGVAAFASTEYWINFAKNYPIYVYNSNSFVYNYVEGYRDYLESLGVTLLDARLISHDELSYLGCELDNNTCLNSLYDWIYWSTYWSGSAIDTNNVLFVNSQGIYTYTRSNGGCGTRPVIEISLTEF